jgi:membrane protein DedA with SNARE-associated domain
VGEDGIRRASGVVGRYGEVAIVLCRPVPVLAEASVVFAGLVHAPFTRFLRLTAFSNLGIAVGYSAFGTFAYREDSVAPFLVAFFGALLLPGVFMLISRLTFGRHDAPS